MDIDCEQSLSFPRFCSRLEAGTETARNAGSYCVRASDLALCLNDYLCAW